jgi:hypothetical protein
VAPTHSYFVVMIRYDRHCEAVVDPEITLRGVIERVASREYKNIVFIHEIVDGHQLDVTEEILVAAGADTDTVFALSPSERLAALHDHNRKLRAETR